MPLSRLLRVASESWVYQLRGGHLSKFTLFLFLTYTVITAAPAQAQLPERSSTPTDQEIQVQQAAHLISAGRWLDGLERYQRILDTAGDELIPFSMPRFAFQPIAAIIGTSAMMLPQQRDVWIPSRWVCHAHLSMLPKSILSRYRSRVDAQATSRLRKLLARQDERGVEQLLSEMFCATPLEEGIDWLALRSFERAEFAKARYYWSMLLLPSGDNTRSHAIHFPNPSRPQAEIHARLILTALFEGKRKEAKLAIDRFRTSFPKEEGMLAGRKGNLGSLLADIYAKPSETFVPANPETRQWSTLGKSNRRNPLLEEDLPYFWPDAPTWVSVLPAAPLKKVERNGAPEPPDHPRSLAYFPIVLGEYAYIANKTEIYAIHLKSGKRSTAFDLASMIDVTAMEGAPATISRRYSLSTAGGLIFVRFGSDRLSPQTDPLLPGKEKGESASSVIACLSPTEPVATPTLRLRWLLRPPSIGMAPPGIFESSPLIEDIHIYAIVVRQVGGDLRRAVVCYRSQPLGDQPELIWHRDIGKVVDRLGNDRMSGNVILSLGHGTLFAVNHAGSVLAMNPETGIPKWVFQYSSSPSQRQDLSPAILSESSLFVAPGDARSVYCLDLFSGQLVWDFEGLESATLLGATTNHLIVTHGGSTQGISALNRKTGSVEPGSGWTHHVDGGLQTFGQGFVTEQMVAWPTRHGLFFLRSSDGMALRSPLGSLPIGNLVYSQGHLLATDSRTIRAYRAEISKRDTPTGTQTKHIKDLEETMQLAKVHANAGRYAEAYRAYRTITLLPLPPERWQVAWITEAEARLTQLFWDRFVSHRRCGSLKKTNEWLRLTAIHDRGVDFRTQYARALLGFDSGLHTKEQIREWAQLFNEEVSQRILCRTSAGGWQRLDLLLRDQFRELDSAEQKRVLDTLQGEFEKISTCSLAKAIAGAKVYRFLPAARFRLVETLRSEHDISPIVRLEAYRLWYEMLHASLVPPSGHEWKLAKEGLDRCLEDQAMSQTPGIRSSTGIDVKAVSTSSVNGVSRGKFDPMVAKELFRPEETDSFVPLQEIESHYPQEGSVDRDGCVWFSSGRQLFKLQTETSKLVPVTFLAFQPTHATSRGESMLLCGPEGIACYSLTRSAIRWQLQTSDLPGPADCELQGIRSGLFLRPSVVFGSFRVFGTQAFAILDERVLVAIDIDSGTILWSRPVSVAQLSGQGLGICWAPHYRVFKEGILVQKTTGVVEILDRGTGQRRGNPLVDQEPWIHDPIFLDRNEAIIPGINRTLLRVSLDPLRIGKPIRLPGSESITGIPPRLDRLHQGILVREACSDGTICHLIDPRSGRPLWREGTFFPRIDPSALSYAEGPTSLFIIDMQGTIRAIAKDTGKVVWQQRLEEFEGSRGIWLDGQSGRLIALNSPPSPFRPLRWSAWWSDPERLGSVLTRLVGWLQISYDRFQFRSSTLLMIDSSQGKELQRLRIPTRSLLFTRVSTDKAQFLLTPWSNWQIR